MTVCSSRTVVVWAVAAVAALALPAGALTGNASWQNVPFTPQSGTFTASFAVLPQAASIDAVVGLSAAPADSYDDCAALVRFNSGGMIDVWNGTAYAAAASVPYISGKTYRFRVVVNVTAHTYNAYVTPPVGSELLLASNYAFRTPQNNVSSLGNWAVIADPGPATVGSFYISGATTPTPPPPSTALAADAGTGGSTGSWRNVPFAAAQSGTFTAQFAANPQASNIDGVIGLSASAAGSKDDCAIRVHFSPSGTIEAWNGSAYAAAVPVPYIGGKVYQIKITVNVTAHTYSVYVTPPGASQVLLASNYAFATTQSTVASLGNWAISTDTGSNIVGSLYISGATAPTTPPPSAALAADAGPAGSIVPGQSMTLAGSAGGGTAPYTYAWSPATGLASATVAASVATPSTTTTYTLTVRDAAGATATDTTTVTVGIVIGTPPPQPPPPPPATGSWQPPIGIPTPPFGINETHTMYKGQTYAYTTGTALYNDAGSGPYTHYVDNTSAASTDTNNPYGTAAKPRKCVPAKLAPGSVVEIHGGPYTTMETIVLAQGTAAQPIFIRGINKPRLPGKMSFFNGTGLECKYAIVEGLSIYKLWAIAPTSYLCFRNNDVCGDAATGGISVDTYNAAYTNHHIVFYKNVVHDNGNWQTNLDQDVHGITVSRYTNNIWILDNEIYHNSGDGLQINAGSPALEPYTHHIYVGRNNSHHNKQSGLWSKQAVDVIFSQNTCHDLMPMGPTPSAWGPGLGCQYAPERVWFLYNHVYNCCFGISTGSSDNMGTGLNSYFIGNVIHDIHHSPAYQYNYRPSSGYSEAGMTFTDSGNKYVINNTIYDCDAGINSPAGGKIVMINNIVSNITEPVGNHILLENPTCSAASDLSYNLFYQNGSPPRFRWAGTASRDLAAVQTMYGKGATCLIGDPLFVNAAAGDFRLQAASPAINHATVSQVYQTFQSLYGLNINVDFYGVTRPQTGASDIGACEYAPGK